jgi:hypothetical protein
MTDRRFLVVIETQKVKEYLFASPTLRETRGASLVLDRLNRQVTRKLLAESTGKVIYLGGGSGKILFESRDAAEAFAERVIEAYRRQAWNVRASVEIAERAEEDFTSWMARGVGESRKNKLARFEGIPLLGGRWIRPCTSCGREPAEEVPPPDVQGAHQLCRSCHLKRREIRGFYSEVKGRYDRQIPIPAVASLRRNWPDFVLTTLAETVESRFGLGVRTILPQDFNDIGALSRPRNYFALIYADGNRMGETIRSMAAMFPTDEEARQAYTAFSMIVDRATREAAVASVLDSVEIQEAETQRREAARVVPAEFVIAGGDDLILVVPADSALGVAERFVSLFQERSRALQEEAVGAGKLSRPFAPEGLTTSAGVVLSHASYPASQLIDLAAELMKIAKRKAADSAQSEGTVDFMTIHESGSESVKLRRQQEYEGRLPTGRIVKRTERPYTASEIRKLCERVKALKSSGIPRGKLKALYAALFRSPVEAQYEALRIRERLEATGCLQKSSALRDMVEDLHLFPFREKHDGVWSTPLSELIEIYDFIHADEMSSSELSAESAHA